MAFVYVIALKNINAHFYELQHALAIPCSEKRGNRAWKTGKSGFSGGGPAPARFAGANVTTLRPSGVSPFRAYSTTAASRAAPAARHQSISSQLHRPGTTIHQAVSCPRPPPPYLMPPAVFSTPYPPPLDPFYFYVPSSVVT
ncbi:Hypothetical protein NTJ_12529 [Nesidiocoris tenuis]|uniref:Uncharacterized protein n=1 Tax=Nesidiocoris tenuis TaxID=355587 RepID=A0ABN7BA69_9HEMI|nr:Hypothetical protein NTJ_12529 [Nesidiocoris tenuis]